ncbi:MAG TPA: phosphate ABC transporter permease PstA [Firmicutes bacterium]|nr:phosphate ABC transporter permease PstA [Bacillota bacterium]
MKRKLLKEDRVKLIFRIFKDKAFFGLLLIFTCIGVLPLFLILFYIGKLGISSLSFDFFVELPKPIGEYGGGVSNAIIGTFLLILFSTILSFPLGLLTGLYMSEFKKGFISSLTNLCIDLLQGVPSIVIGIIAYIWLVKPFGKFSGFSGSFALALLMVPIIAKTTEETLKMIPYSLKEAALALGIPYYKTILKVILPAGTSGILTGVLIGIARVAGETAPLLFTAFGSPFMNLNIFKPINSIPLMIFNYATSPYPDWHKLAWGASFILIVFVLTLNLVSKWIMKKFQIRF